MANDFRRQDSRLPLTVCMIVRDEADKLAAALESVRAVAAEIVVVDTGSADATVAIAESFGARVLYFAWVDDFAKARNVGLDAATGDWILSLDADQRLAPESVPALARAVGRRDVLAQVVTIAMLHVADAGSDVSTYAALRLFRRDPRIRYAGRVHEDVSDALLAAGGADWPDSGVRLLDRGYVDPQDRQRKRLRNLALLRRSAAEVPQSAYLAYKLAITLTAESERDERRAVLERGLARVRGLPANEVAGLTFLPRFAALGAEELVAQGRLVDAAALLRALRAAAGPVLDFPFGVALARAGLFDEATARLEACARRGAAPRGGLVLHDDDDSPARALLWLAWIGRMRGDLDAAAEALRRAEAGAPPGLALALACERIELQLARGDLAAVPESLDAAATAVAAGVRGERRGLPGLMLASAKFAQHGGHADMARELVREAFSGRGDDADDDAGVLRATLEITAGPVAPDRLREHHDAIAGRRFDTLAVKRLIGDSLGIPWPHAVPDATRDLLAALRGE